MRNGSVTRTEGSRLVDILGGEDVVRTIIANSGLSFEEPLKFGDWTGGQVEDLLTKLGDEIARRIASGELTVEVKDGFVIVKETENPFVDSSARGIPFQGMKEIVDANRSFNFGGPFEVNYKLVHNRLQRHFGWKYEFMPVSEFEIRCNAVLEFVRNNLRIANLLKGPHFPWVMPKLSGDIGKLLNDVIVPVLESSYKEDFSSRSFTNYRYNKLVGKVIVVDGTRQDILVSAMAESSTCGVYFPALQGFGITADREWIKKVPEQRLILSGMEVPVVVAAYPNICGYDCSTLGLDMASLRWQSSANSLSFYTGVGSADFGNRGLGASERCAGGVSILG